MFLQARNKPIRQAIVERPSCSLSSPEALRPGVLFALCAAGWIALGACRQTTMAAEANGPVPAVSSTSSASSTGVVPCRMGSVAESSQPLDQRAASRDPACLIEDVVLFPGGTLLGRVERITARRILPDCAPVSIAVYRAGTLVATATVDSQGRFLLRGLSGGFYQLVAQAGRTCTRRLVRAWTAEAAPPVARPMLYLPIIEHSDPASEPGSPWADTWQVVRAQNSAMRLAVKQVVTTTAIVAGAVSVPIIYKDVKRDSFIPATEDTAASP